jgi:hypothetical protein
VGQINVPKLAEWRRANASLLEKFPQLDYDLQNAQRAQNTFDFYQKRANAGQKTVDSQAYLSTLINNTSPTAAISEALSFTPKGSTKKDPVQGLKRLFRLTSVKFRDADGKLLPRAEQEAMRIKINEGYQNAILQYAFMGAGGESINTFDPATFHKTMFGKIEGSNFSLVDVAKQYGILSDSDITRMRTISNQMVRLAAADAAGKLDDPELQKQAGPIFDFYVGLVGSAAGTKTYSALTGGQSGTGAISAAAQGRNAIMRLLRDTPASARMEAMQLIFKDPELAAILLRPAKNEAEQVRQLSRVQQFFLNRGFSIGSSQQPFVIREMYEDEDRGTGATIEDMIGPQSSVEPTAAPIPTQPAVPPTNAFASVSPPPPPPAPASGTVDRARFAAMFPEDRALIEGIGSLMG